MNKRLALIISNGDYDDPTLTRLTTPERDAGSLARILRDPAIGRFDDVQILLNEPTATVQRAIAHFFARKKRDDLLLLYFSGHGLLDERGRLYLAMKNTERELLTGSAVPAAFITDEMDRSRSRRQVLILDCCHSGAFARGAKGEVGRPVGTGTIFRGNGSGRIILTASDATEYAWEGDRLIGDAQNSVFTRYLVQGMTTGAADTNQDGIITLDELYDYVYEQVVCQAAEGQMQTPGKWVYKQQGDIILAYNNTILDLGMPILDSVHPAEAQNPKSTPARRGQNPLRPRFSWFWLVPFFVLAVVANFRWSNAGLAAAVLGKGATHTPTASPTSPHHLADIAPAVTPSPSHTPTITLAPATPTATVTHLPSASTVAAAGLIDLLTTETPPATATPSPTPTGHPVRLFYNDTSVYLWNGGNQRLQLRSLAFEALDAAGQRTHYRFNGRYWTEFFSYVEPGSCAAIESKFGPNLQPGICNSFNAIFVLTIPLDQAEVTFWLPQRGGDAFRVLWNEDEAGRCRVNESPCRVYLPVER
jgi:hypothetical protein